MKKDRILVLAVLIGGLFGLAARPWNMFVPSGDDGDRVPLRLIMVSLGQEMSRINDGLWHEDYDMIARAARQIADHPRVTAEEMTAIKQQLGDGFEVFVGFDRFVHETATELDSVARARDMSGVLQAQRQLQQGCLSCHTAFRKTVRSALY